MAKSIKHNHAGQLSHSLSVKDVKTLLSQASSEDIHLIESSLSQDNRRGIKNEIERAKKRLAQSAAETQRLKSLYSYEIELASNNENAIILGLDEVGRGPLAGPLAIGGAVLSHSEYINGLNDSKQIPHTRRAKVFDEIVSKARALTIVYIEPEEIDIKGMTFCLKKAFSQAIKNIEDKGIIPDVILLDGNPLHIDQREINVIKGDARCASIAAASIYAKETRDSLMVEYAQIYPQYHFEDCKGYASKAHIEAIKQYGLTPIHRKSFCSAFSQPSLFDFD